ncbi:hypothetical protein CPC08DRAFT_91276 [Agrocybe pediades]|nr:hypothetical protein CPC08DRAFT_91276 [Agrocybe pediades]
MQFKITLAALSILAAASAQTTSLLDVLPTCMKACAVQAIGTCTSPTLQCLCAAAVPFRNCVQLSCSAIPNSLASADLIISTCSIV